MNTATELYIPQKAIFTQEDLAEFFGISRWTIQKIRKKGYLKSIPGCGKIRIPRAEVVRYLEATGGES
jgi:predicted site-specific integrase-resolvase